MGSRDKRLSPFDTLLAAPRKSELLPTENPEPSVKGMVSVRWGRHKFEIKAEDVWNPDNPQHNPPCAFCRVSIYEKDGRTLRDANGVPRGMCDWHDSSGRAVALHCDCYRKLHDNNLTLVSIGKSMGASTEWKGRFTEYLIVQKLQSLKFETYTSTDSDSHVDVLARKDNKIVPIQIRSAAWNSEEEEYYTNLRIGKGRRKWTTMERDVAFVIVVGFRPIVDGPEVYVFPSFVLAGKQNIRFTPEGKYVQFRGAWWILFRYLKHGSVAEVIEGVGKKEVDFITSYKESKIRFPHTRKTWAFTRSGTGIVEINVRNILIGLKPLFEDERESENFQFLFFLTHEISRAVVHELGHVFHDEVMGAWHDDEEDVDRLSKDMLYGEDFVPGELPL